MEKKYLALNIANITKQRNFFMAMTIICGITCLLLSIRIVTSEDRVILVPGIHREAWIEKGGVDPNYLEDYSNMLLPLLLDLDYQAIDWKKEHLMDYVSRSDPKYIKAINDYYAKIKQEYELYKMSTHFAPNNFDVDPKAKTVIAKGMMISRFGERGLQRVETKYLLKFEWKLGRLLLKEFLLVKDSEGEDKNGGKDGSLKEGNND